LHRKFNFSSRDLNSIILFFKENFLIKNLDIFTLEKTVAIMEKYNYSYWDSMMLASAIESDCSVIYSEDMQHGQTIDGKLKIINPFSSDDNK
jgi:predicted nucleic acid-binding protein